MRGRGPSPNLASPARASPPLQLRPGPAQASGLYSTAGASPGRAGTVVVPAASPPRPVVSGSPFSPQPRALCEGEGVWVEGMYLCVVTEPTPPFAIVAASRGWLQFCGFDAKEVKGRTLSMLQGPATERVVAAKLVSAAHKGVATDAVLVNYTKAPTPNPNPNPTPRCSARRSLPPRYPRPKSTPKACTAATRLGLGLGLG